MFCIVFPLWIWMKKSKIKLDHGLWNLRNISLGASLLILTQNFGSALIFGYLCNETPVNETEIISFYLHRMPFDTNLLSTDQGSHFSRNVNLTLWCVFLSQRWSLFVSLVLHSKVIHCYLNTYLESSISSSRYKIISFWNVIRQKTVRREFMASSVLVE